MEKLTDAALIILNKVEEFHDLTLKKSLKPLKFTLEDEKRREKLMDYINRLNITSY
jgi:hypothetical protein